MAEGARLESVFRGNSNVGSNPTLSAIIKLLKLKKLTKIPQKLRYFCATTLHELEASTMGTPVITVFVRHVFIDGTA